MPVCSVVLALSIGRGNPSRQEYIFLGGNCFRPIHFVRYSNAPFWKAVKVTSMDSYHEDEERAKDFIWREAQLKRREGNDALICISHTDALEEFWQF